MAAVEAGSVLEGKVTGITAFGAFVALPEGKSGLVHISEVANTYVNDVHEHLTVGQTVRVKVLAVTPEGKINLSIKRAQETEPRRGESAPRRAVPARAADTAPVAADRSTDFEDRLKRFMQESDSRMADNRLYSEHKQRNRRR